MFVILPNSIPELQDTPLPPKCYELGSVPRLLALPMFHFKLTFKSIKELGSNLHLNWAMTFVDVENIFNNVS